MGSIEARTEEPPLEEISSDEASQVKNILKDRGYGHKVLERIYEFYENRELSSSDPEEQADRIEAKLPEIYPERYHKERFSTDEANDIYSVALQGMAESDFNTLPCPSYHAELEISDFEGTDAVFLDHNIVYNILDRSTSLKNVIPLEHRIKPLREVIMKLENNGGGLEALDEGELISEVKDCLDRASFCQESIDETMIRPWYEHVELIDYVNETNFLELYYPGDLREKAERYTLKRENHNLFRELEVINSLEEIGKPLEIPGKRVKELDEEGYDEPEDRAIIESLQKENRKFILATCDYDFKKLLGEEYKDPDIIPMLPDCAKMVIKALDESKHSETVYSK